jgi:uncharacterized membrane protein YfcA
MLSVVSLLQSILVIMTLGFGYVFVAHARKNQEQFSKVSWTKLSVLGFVMLFLDTLGVGWFAPATALFRFFKLVPDKIIPGTLNVSATVPVVAEALIFITVIQVDATTLVTMVIAAAVGAVLGAGVVAKLPEKKIQLGMGVALLIVAFIFIAGLFHLMPVGGEAIGLVGISLLVAVVGNFILGALMTIGIGLYAPCMALVYALGLSAKVAFPIMMASCAFLLPAGSIRFIKESAYDLKASVAITLAGIVGVLVAAYIVKELPLEIVKWLVTLVVVYTGASLLKTALKD